MRYRVLGPFEVWAGSDRVDLSRSKERDLLALLVLRANTVVSTDRLVDELWGGSPPASAVATLRAHISRLRKALGADGDALETHGSGYLLRVDPAHVDSSVFGRLVEEARRRVAIGDPQGGSEVFAEALRLWTGPPLGGVSGAQSIPAEAVRLEEEHCLAVEQWVEANLCAGRHAQMVAELEALTAAYPLRETLWGLQMLALYRCGRQADALRAYDELRRILRDELGLEPSNTLRRLEAAILSQDTSLDAPPAMSPASPNVGTPPSMIVANVRHAFVGRDDELDRLGHWWREVCGGARRVVFVSGEPGIGKTRLVTEFAAAVHRDGGLIIAGRCDEYLSAPYQPFVEAFRDFVGRRTGLAAEPQTSFSDLAEIVAVLEPGGPPERFSGSEAERFRLFGSVASFLDRLASDRPVLVLLEDLHWADTASGLLVRYLGRQRTSSSIMILGTYRDVDLADDHPLRDSLADVRQGLLGERIHLGGLGAEAVADLVSDEVGGPLDPAALAFARSLWHHTDGNPFFIEEVMGDLRTKRSADGRWIDDGGLAGIGIPEGIRDAIARRIRRLGDAAAEMLPVAAVMGSGFRADALERACGLPERVVLDALEELTHAGLVAEAGGTVGAYCFTHDLVREAVRERLSLLRRVRLHGRIAEVLEDLYSADLDAHVPELAYHFVHAAAHGPADKAIDYARRAGDQALAALAYEDAIVHYRSALEVLDGGAPSHVAKRERARLLLLLAEANRRLGDATVSRQRFLEAAALARRVGDGELLACAAIGLGLGSGGLTRATRADEELIALLDEAITVLPPGDSALRVAVLARLAEELYYSAEFERRLAIADDAVAMAERVADTAVIVEARYSREWCRLGPDVPVEDRIASSAELVAVARDLGAGEREFDAHLLREHVLLERGDFVGARRALDGAAAVAAKLRIPMLEAWVVGARARHAWLAGRFDEADSLNGEAWSLALAPGGDADAAMLILGGQAMAQQVLRADMNDFVAPLRQFADQYPQHPIAYAFLAYVLVTLDRPGEAVVALDGVAGDDFGAVRRDMGWLLWVWATARVLAVARDRHRAARLYDQVLAHAQLWSVSWGAQLCFGPVSTSLGVLASAAERPDVAAAHFEAAMAETARLGCRPWRAEAAYWYGRVVCDTGERRDLGRRLGDLVLAECDSLGMAELAARARAVWPGSSR